MPRRDFSRAASGTSSHAARAALSRGLKRLPMQIKHRVFIDSKRTTAAEELHRALPELTSVSYCVRSGSTKQFVRAKQNIRDVPTQSSKIGRASCRERAEITDVVGA